MSSTIASSVTRWSAADGEHRPRVAMVDRPHGVECVREDRCAGIERRAHGVVVGVRVSDRGGRAARDHDAHRLETAGDLRRDRHLPHGAAAGLEQSLDVAAGRLAEQLRIVCALVSGIEERALQVAAQDVGIRLAQVRDLGDPRRQRVERPRHQ
ncbi:hypothetical protein L2X99_09755 [Microbacterium sp. KUDC0406]|uniref:hypothetical protein n=1 Tax=Microbacterium sp. KUDC0406 TaxID=2909588 RepID=UPI001F157FE9|nr:hypothetical protein [Microbacterium sp. KUDC0406]UJP08797.1 hypothetical protein L2X99_09755 [Microbacterium sp. KUDC0406]